VLLNLAVNARDAMPRGGTLSIQTGAASPPESLLPNGAAAPPNGWVSLAISDTGTGIAPDVQPRIFEPFFTTKGPGKGTGLGLSTVYGIINQSGGYIGLETRQGVGTTFTIYLPAVHDAVESLKPEIVREPGVGTETILLVEDDTRIRQLIRKVLIGRGYTVLDTLNGTEALAVSAHYDGVIHLLLTDIVMPELYGPEVAQRIVARRPNLSVLYISGFTDRLGIDLGTLSGAASFLHKPFTPDTLVMKVRECLERSQTRILSTHRP
jgi:CheY-like chemotaxis protein